MAELVDLDTLEELMKVCLFTVVKFKYSKIKGKRRTGELIEIEEEAAVADISLRGLDQETRRNLTNIDIVGRNITRIRKRGGLDQRETVMKKVTRVRKERKKKKKRKGLLIWLKSKKRP